jgi:hypothetical protein
MKEIKHVNYENIWFKLKVDDTLTLNYKFSSSTITFYKMSEFSI